MGLTVEEALLGITRNGALALGRDDLGVLREGAPADVSIFSPQQGEPLDASCFVQHLTGPDADVVLRDGRIIRANLPMSEPGL